MFTDIIAERYLNELTRRYPALAESTESLDKVYCSLKNVFFNQKTLFCCGNGGSASDCEHIVGELMKGFISKRRLPAEELKKINEVAGEEGFAEKLQGGMRCISLLSHSGLNSAFTNDVDPLMTYAQQLYVLGREGDAILGISTSGNAVNICNAFKVAKAKGITTILMTGLNHGICEKYADHILRGPEMETYKIQEYHLPIYHCLCLMLEEAFYGK